MHTRPQELMISAPKHICRRNTIPAAFGRLIRSITMLGQPNGAVSHTLQGPDIGKGAGFD